MCRICARQCVATGGKCIILFGKLSINIFHILYIMSDDDNNIIENNHHLIIRNNTMYIYNCNTANGEIITNFIAVS